MKNVKIVREEKTVFVAKSYLINASQFGTPEFYELMKISMSEYFFDSMCDNYIADCLDTIQKCRTA